MARVTVEDCLKKIPNRFKLVLIASERAKRINAGATLTLSRENAKNKKKHKDTVLSLREIAEGTINAEDLLNTYINNAQKSHKYDISEDDYEENDTLTEILQEEDMLLSGTLSANNRLELIKDEEDFEGNNNEDKLNNSESFDQDNLDVND